jgi:hypothetical protein
MKYDPKAVPFWEKKKGGPVTSIMEQQREFQQRKAMLCAESMAKIKERIAQAERDVGIKQAEPLGKKGRAGRIHAARCRKYQAQKELLAKERDVTVHEEIPGYNPKPGGESDGTRQK